MNSKGTKYAKRRSRLISLRLSEDEYRVLTLSYVGSGARNLSDHLRNLLGARNVNLEQAGVEPDWLKTLNRKIATLTEKVDGLASRGGAQENRDFSATGN